MGKLHNMILIEYYSSCSNLVPKVEDCDPKGLPRRYFQQGSQDHYPKVPQGGFCTQEENNFVRKTPSCKGPLGLIKESLKVQNRGRKTIGENMSPEDHFSVLVFSLVDTLAKR